MTRLQCFTSLVLVLLITVNTHANPKPNQLLRLATTTSTDNTGLLKAILPTFESSSGYKVKVIAVGTGKALRMGRDGDVDVVLVHARNAEEAFVDKGYGVNRQDVMYNEFVLVGPKADPADIKSAPSARAALQQIATTQQKFISRGDDSGTHKKELTLWDESPSRRAKDWYLQVGQGMGKVLQIAGELDAYTLSDSGTWLVYKEKLPLERLYSGDNILFNPYGIIAVNPARHTDANHTGALALIDWITSDIGQQLIGEFRFHGEQLFQPNAKHRSD